MFGSIWKFLLLAVILLVSKSMSAPIPQADNADDFRYPENPDEMNNMPMATVRPSINPCI